MELKKAEHFDVLAGNEPTVETDGVVVPHKMYAPRINGEITKKAFGDNAVIVTQDMIEIEPVSAMSAGKSGPIVLIKLANEVMIRIDLYGRLVFLTDDNYFAIRTKEKVYLVENKFTNQISDIAIRCVGSHGGINNCCDNCTLNMEEHPYVNEEPEVRRLYVATMACELSKHYFGGTPYWFQQRINIREIKDE